MLSTSDLQQSAPISLWGTSIRGTPPKPVYNSISKFDHRFTMPFRPSLTFASKQSAVLSKYQFLLATALASIQWATKKKKSYNINTAWEVITLRPVMLLKNAFIQSPSLPPFILSDSTAWIWAVLNLVSRRKVTPRASWGLHLIKNIHSCRGIDTSESNKGQQGVLKGRLSQ